MVYSGFGFEAAALCFARLGPDVVHRIREIGCGSYEVDT